MTEVLRKNDKWVYRWYPRNQLTTTAMWLRETLGDWGYINYKGNGSYEFVFHRKCHLEWFIMRWGNNQ